MDTTLQCVCSSPAPPEIKHISPEQAWQPPQIQPEIEEPPKILPENKEPAKIQPESKEHPKIQPETKEPPKIQPETKEAAPAPATNVPPSAPPLNQVMKAEPGCTSEEEREREAKKARRLKHNARVRFDRTFNSCLSHEDAKI